MQATQWTVITTPAARSERWAAWISARRTFETPLLALAFAAAAFELDEQWEFAFSTCPEPLETVGTVQDETRQNKAELAPKKAFCRRPRHA